MKPKRHIFERGFFFWQGNRPVGLTDNTRAMVMVGLTMLCLLGMAYCAS